MVLVLASSSSLVKPVSLKSLWSLLLSRASSHPCLSSMPTSCRALTDPLSVESLQTRNLRHDPGRILRPSLPLIPRSSAHLLHSAQSFPTPLLHPLYLPLTTLHVSRLLSLASHCPQSSCLRPLHSVSICPASLLSFLHHTRSSLFNPCVHAIRILFSDPSPTSSELAPLVTKTAGSSSSPSPR